MNIKLSKYFYNLFFLSLAVSFTFFSTNVLAKSRLDYVIAVVNNDVITAEELRKKIFYVKKQIKQQRISAPQEAKLRQQVLERLIVTRIQLQKASLNNIRVDDETLNKTMASIASQNKLTLKEFREVLLADGFKFAEFREEIRNEIIIRRLRQRFVDSRVQVTEQDINNFLKIQKNQNDADTEYQIGHILLALPEDVSPDQLAKVKEKAVSILDKLKNGASFAEIAISDSDGQKALEGGDLGWRKQSEIPSLFSEVITKMKKGEVGQLLRSASGFHIIKLKDIRSQIAEKIMVKQTKVRHILIPTNDLRSSEQAHDLLASLVERISSGENFADLAKQYSEDKVSAANGGDLGWVNPGKMVAEFEMQMNQSQISQLSPIFKTKFGWHVLEVLERKSVDQTKAVNRSKIHQALFKRKAEEQQLEWIKNLREEAFIDIRLKNAAL